MPSDAPLDLPLDLPLVPAPLRTTATGGAPLVLGPGARVVVDAGVPAAEREEVTALAAALAAGLTRSCGADVPVAGDEDPGGADSGGADPGGAGAVVLRLAATAAELDLPDDPADPLLAEAHRLDVGDGRAVLAALRPTGLRHAATTLLQLAARGTSLPAATVVDVPRYAWRGLSVDVARHFVAPRTLEAVLDVMAALKLNVLHLHLTDDQGWRLDVPSRPQLVARSSGSAVGGDPGGHYAQEEWAALIASAAARGITVVPEVDVPGHVNAAQHALPELNPSGEPTPVHTGIEVGFSQLHADLPATLPFLRDVLGDVAAMTPGPYLHVGGDEALTMRAGEYAELVEAAAAVVRDAGKVPVGWQEVAKARLAPGTVVQFWDEREGAEHVVAAAAAGARVLLSPATRTYLDLKYDADFPLGLEWAGHVEVRDAYEWEPADVLPGLPPGSIAGVEACLWTETIRTPEDLFRMLLPRLAAVAEVAWSAPHRRGWDGFARRVAAHARDWDAAGLAWHRSPQVSWD